jgi:lactoylglutathione lyase
MSKAHIPDQMNDTVEAQHLGLIHLTFALESSAAVDAKAAALKAAGYPLLRGPRMTGDGYYEFETLDPDLNRLEVIFRP